MLPSFILSFFLLCYFFFSFQFVRFLNRSTFITRKPVQESHARNMSFPSSYFIFSQISSQCFSSFCVCIIVCHAFCSSILLLHAFCVCSSMRASSTLELDHGPEEFMMSSFLPARAASSLDPVFVDGPAMQAPPQHDDAYSFVDYASALRPSSLPLPPSAVPDSPVSYANRIHSNDFSALVFPRRSLPLSSDPVVGRVHPPSLSGLDDVWRLSSPGQLAGDDTFRSPGQQHWQQADASSQRLDRMKVCAHPLRVVLSFLLVLFVLLSLL